MTDSDTLLMPHEAAAFLRTTKQSLADWRTQGDGAQYLRVGERIFYRTSDLAAFQESGNQSK